MTLPGYMRGEDFDNDTRALVTAIVSIASVTNEIGNEIIFQAILDAQLPRSMNSGSVRGQLLVKAIAASVSVDKAMLNIPGGIDFNPNNFTLNQQGRNAQFNLPNIRPAFQNQSIDGILPIIINITPITNFPLLIFGEGQSPSENSRQQLSRSLN